MNILFQCLGVTGIIFLFYGLVTVLITNDSSDMFFKTLMGLGAIFLLSFIIEWLVRVSKQPAMLRDMFQKRSTKSGAGMVVYSLIVLAILVVVNIQSQKMFHTQKDFTSNKVHTLSDQTIKKITNLDEPVKLTVFMDEANQAKPILKDLLSRYSRQSKKVQVKFVDADKEKLLAEKYGVKDGDVVVEHKGQSHITQEYTEQGITQSIMKVSRTSTPTLCFTKGHGELSLDGPDDDPRSISFIKGGLGNEGFVSKSLDNIAGGVPSDCSSLIIAGPTQKFPEADSAAVDSYLQSGGKAMVLLDPNFPDPKLVKSSISLTPTGLESTLAKWGVDLGSNLILEKQLQLLRGVRIVPTIRAQKYGDHPITEPLKTRGVNTIFDRARSVSKKEGFDGTAVELAFSAPEGNSWAIRDIDAVIRQGKMAFGNDDIQGNVPFGVAVEKDLKGEKEGESKTKTKQSQLVVFGDSDFMSNAMIRSYEFNFDLVLNSLNWLAGESESISIRPKQFQSSVIELSPQQSNVIFYVVIVTIPMLILTFGLNLWLYRRKVS